MKNDLIEIRNEIARILYALENNEWATTVLRFTFPPYINKGWTGSQFFYDVNGDKVETVVFGDDKFNTAIYKFISETNKDSYQINQVVFKGQKEKLDEAEISASFDQNIVDQFESNLPKSKRGKTIPWWKNPEEIKGLV